MTRVTPVKIWYCMYCALPFGRKEHLLRHHATHSPYKPFACNICQDSFKRKDLLDRHKSTKHQGQFPLPEDMDCASLRRPIACTICAKAKTKCDKAEPSCSRCLSKGLVCQPRSTRRSNAAKELHRRAQRRPTQSVNLPPRPWPQSSLPSFAPTIGESLAGSMSASLSPGELTPPGTPESLMPPFGRPTAPGQPFTTEILSSSPLWAFGGDADRNVDMQQSEYSGQVLHGTDHYAQPAVFVQAPWNPSSYGRSFPSFSESNETLPGALTPTSTESPTVGPSSPISFVQEDAHQAKARWSWSEPMNLGQIATKSEPWLWFRCNPTAGNSTSCASNSREYVPRLKAILQNAQTWEALQPVPDLDDEVFTSVDVAQSEEDTRLKLMSFLRAVLKTSSFPSDVVPSDGPVTLPPTSTLDKLMLSYACRFEAFYPLNETSTVNPDDLINTNRGLMPGLLMLLMIAAGSASLRSGEAQQLTQGLTEACRHPLMESIERNAIVQRDPVALRSALLFLNLAAWSGEKWHTDITIGQPSIYFTMVRNSGVLSCPPLKLPALTPGWSANEVICSWREHEATNRLAYSWMVVDQELSLFSDKPLQLQAADIAAPLPKSDTLWRDVFDDAWLQAFLADGMDGSRLTTLFEPRPSLQSLFDCLERGTLSDKANTLTPLDLRLLIHPLQSVVAALHQSLQQQTTGDRNATYTIRQRLIHIETLLSYWYNAYVKVSSHTTDSPPAMCASLAMYHLVSLNTMVDFPLVERLTRNEISLSDYLSSFFPAERFAVKGPQVVYHCGQLIRLFRLMPRANRPLWWDAIMYRVSLILWSSTLTNASMASPAIACHALRYDQVFAVENLTPEDEAIVNYRRFGEGVPVLAKTDGSNDVVLFNTPSDVLNHCIEVLHENTTYSHFGMGIRKRLIEFAQRAWTIGTSMAVSAPPSATEQMPAGGPRLPSQPPIHDQPSQINQHSPTSPIEQSSQLGHALPSRDFSQAPQEQYHTLPLESMPLSAHPSFDSSFDSSFDYTLPIDMSSAPLDQMSIAQMHLQEFNMDHMAMGMPWPAHVENLHASHNMFYG